MQLLIVIVFFITFIPSINLFAQLNAVFPDKICKLPSFYLVVLERSNADRRYVPAEFFFLNFITDLPIRLEVRVILYDLIVSRCLRVNMTAASAFVNLPLINYSLVGNSAVVTEI